MNVIRFLKVFYMDSIPLILAIVVGYVVGDYVVWEGGKIVEIRFGLLLAGAVALTALFFYNQFTRRKLKEEIVEELKAERSAEP